MPPTNAGTPGKDRAKTAQKSGKKCASPSPPTNPHNAESIAAKLVRQSEFLKALCSNRFNVSVACEKTGIARRTFYRWLEEDPDFVEKHKDVMESRLDKWEECLHKNIVAGSSSDIRFGLTSKGKSRGYGVKEVPVDAKVVNILAEVVAGTETVTGAAYRITMLGYPLPEIIKLQLQKGAGEDEGDGTEDKTPASPEELERRYLEAIASKDDQCNTFLPERQAEVLAIKDELKAAESFGPGGVAAEMPEELF